MKTFGIDISRWQGDFDLDAAKKEGVQFVIIKGGGGDSGLYVDSKFTRNYTEAKKRGLPVGVYWFSKALTVTEAEKEAEYFYTNVLKGRQFELPVYIDVEHKSQLALSKRLLTDIIKAWCSYLEKKSFWVGIYSSLSYFSSNVYDKELTAYAHWVASWAASCSYSNTSCFGMWQFGGETNKIRPNKVAGVVCDQDYMLTDYPTRIKAAGLNGFTKSTSKQTTASTTFAVGDKVKCNTGVTTFAGGQKMSSWVPAATLYVRAVESSGKILLVSTEKTKAVYTGRVNASDVHKI
jgi:hypothetical protein